jgi:hypothetical protein
MGSWIGPDNIDQQLEILRKVDPDRHIDPSDFIVAMAQSGLLLRKAYYVPDADELFGVMKTIQYGVYRGLTGCRWVMCRETVDALARRYVGQRTPEPPVFPNVWSDEADVMYAMPTAVHVIENATLFGVPIRIDPAARSPMFEIDTEATETRPDHVLNDWKPEP